jgi:hypothetical protein
MVTSPGRKSGGKSSNETGGTFTMPKQKVVNCPMKFNSKTLEADGYVKKESCQCDEENCGWWRPVTNQCAVISLVEIVNKMELVAGLQLKAMLPDMSNKTTIVDVER